MGLLLSGLCLAGGHASPRVHAQVAFEGPELALCNLEAIEVRGFRSVRVRMNWYALQDERGVTVGELDVMANEVELVSRIPGLPSMDIMDAVARHCDAGNWVGRQCLIYDTYAQNISCDSRWRSVCGGIAEPVVRSPLGFDWRACR